MQTTISRPSGLGVATSVAPRDRVRSAGDVLRLIGGLVLVAVGMSVAAGARSTIRGIEQDVSRGVGYLPDRVEEALFGLALVIAVALPILAIVVLLVRRRFAFVVSLVVASWLAASLMATLASALVDWGVLARDAAADDGDVGFGDPRFATSPLIASTVAIVVMVSPRVSVRWRRMLWGLVGLLAVVRIVGATEPPLDIVVALGIGLAVGGLLLLAVGSPSFDPDGAELVRMLRDAGVDPSAVEQIESTTGLLTYRVSRAGQHPLLLRLRTPHDRSADLLDRLWRRLRARPTAPGHPLSSTKRQIEREALALTVARMGGVRVPLLETVVAEPSGSVGLAVQDTGARRLSELVDDDVGDEVLDDAWRQLDLLHRRRVAHRELDLDHLQRDDDGRTWLVGFDRAAVAADDRELGRDVAQLLVDMALAVGPDRAVRRAAHVLGDDALRNALPYLQPLALPPRTRAAARRHRAVLEGVRARAAEVTGTADIELARIDRIRPRTLVMLGAIVLALYVVLPQLANVRQTAEAARGADWRWLPAMVAAALLTYVFAAVSFRGSVPARIPFWSTLRAQVAADFAGLITPGSTGGLALGLRYLQRSGVETPAATAAVGVNAVGGFVVHLSLLVAFVAWTGTSGIGLPSLPDTSLLVLGSAVMVAVVGVAAAVRPLRERVLGPAVNAGRGAVGAVRSVATNPVRVLQLVAGSTGVTLSYIVVLVATLEAFGGGLSFPQVGAAYLGAATVASVSPTPGGLGAFEVTLIAALSGFGLDKGTAVSAALAFRLLTYWIPTLPGWLMFHWMERNHEL